MQDSLNDKQKQVISKETAILKEVQESLQSQIDKAALKLRQADAKARVLTAGLVEARRDEDKAMLASDEAVSHRLKDSKHQELESLQRVFKDPYFARLVVNERADDGSQNTLEYKIGHETNLDCRIIDWRKAPISKLYYEYKEGEEYFEEILGKEREGTINTRNRLEIKSGRLRKISCRHGTLEFENDEWSVSKQSAKSDSNNSRLPDVLSLITAEQFRMITEEADTSILIQGVAGSGKTTVAIHRLSWLLANNSDCHQGAVGVVVLSNTLKNYIANSLKALDSKEIKVFNFVEWVETSLTGRTHSLPYSSQPTPLTSMKIKSSADFFELFEEMLPLVPFWPEVMSERIQTYLTLLDMTLSREDKLVGKNKNTLITRECLQKCRVHTDELLRTQCITQGDLPYLLRLSQHFSKNIFLPDGTHGLFEHLVVDEIQDMSPAHLACIRNAVTDLWKLTLVGDINQNVSEHGTFPGWKYLTSSLDANSAKTRFIQLEVSFRSTLEIMRCADAVRGVRNVKSGRRGRKPIWFQCNHSSDGLTQAIKWLEQALKRYPHHLTAVICKSEKEAREVYTLMRATFLERVRIGTARSFSFEEGVVVTDVASVKGLEFVNVLIWNPSSKSYRTHDNQDRNRLYVAITRAEENLCIVTWGRPSSYLPPESSRLMRVVNLIEEEEDTDHYSKR